jgi:DNA-binding transcriptional MerR regulator
MAKKKSTRSRKKKGTARRGRASAAVERGELDLGSDKLYFKIGEVAEIVGVPAYVLRYWETEFRAIRPQKSRSQQRVYRRRDVETVLKIKSLLYDKKFTIAGARQELEQSQREGREIEPAAPAVGYRARQSLERVKDQLSALSAMIMTDEEPDPAAADPAEYLKARGGARAILAGNADLMGSTQPLLSRPERDVQ